MYYYEKMHCVEFLARDMAAIRVFFGRVFGWMFVDYGSGYTAFLSEGLDGGFFKSDLSASTGNGSALVVFYSNNLEQTQLKIEKAGGLIIKPVLSFPGGRRFHFGDPNGNEYAVWSDIGV